MPRLYRSSSNGLHPTFHFPLSTFHFPLLTYFSTSSTFPLFHLSEAGPEPELHHPRLVRDVLVRLRRPVQRAALVGHERVEVLVVEHVEHLEDARDAGVRGEPELALQPHVHAMQRRAVER